MEMREIVLKIVVWMVLVVGVWYAQHMILSGIEMKVSDIRTSVILGGFGYLVGSIATFFVLLIISDLPSRLRALESKIDNLSR